MKFLAILISFFSITTYAVTIDCKQGEMHVQVFHVSGYEHRVQVIERNHLIGSQGKVFCGPRTSYTTSGRIEGGSCNSHLGVGADARYRLPTGFSISYNFVTGRSPQRHSGKAVANLTAVFRNQIN